MAKYKEALFKLCTQSSRERAHALQCAELLEKI
jgi:hypothetical protein